MNCNISGCTINYSSCQTKNRLIRASFTNKDRHVNLRWLNCNSTQTSVRPSHWHRQRAWLCKKAAQIQEYRTTTDMATAEEVVIMYLCWKSQSTGGVVVCEALKNIPKWDRELFSIYQREILATLSDHSKTQLCSRPMFGEVTVTTEQSRAGV